jgi:hypothetical protein
VVHEAREFAGDDAQVLRALRRLETSKFFERRGTHAETQIGRMVEKFEHDFSRERVATGSPELKASH